MLKITKPFSASENGIDIVKYKKDSLHEELPPVALAHGNKIEAIAEEKSQAELAAEAKKDAEAKAKKDAEAKAKKDAEAKAKKDAEANKENQE